MPHLYVIAGLISSFVLFRALVEVVKGDHERMMKAIPMLTIF